MTKQLVIALLFTAVNCQSAGEAALYTESYNEYDQDGEKYLTDPVQEVYGSAPAEV